MATPTWCGVRERVLQVVDGLRNQASLAPWARPEPRAFDDAVQFVRAWADEPVHMPDIGVAEDGELNFLWKAGAQGQVHVDLGFYGDGTYSYYAAYGQGREYERDDVSPSEGLTEELLTILSDPAETTTD